MACLITSWRVWPVVCLCSSILAIICGDNLTPTFCDLVMSVDIVCKLLAIIFNCYRIIALFIICLHSIKKPLSTFLNMPINANVGARLPPAIVKMIEDDVRDGYYRSSSEWVRMACADFYEKRKRERSGGGALAKRSRRGGGPSCASTGPADSIPPIGTLDLLRGFKL